MEPSQQIKAYFEAQKGNVEAVVPYLAEDVSIEDTGENNVVRGVGQCGEWLRAMSRKYRMETRLLETAEQEDGRIRVSAQVTVSGDAAPGTYKFDYFFELADGKIQNVKIVFIGD
jgi:hypothetical protein